MDDAGHRENGRHKPEMYKPPHSQVHWCLNLQLHHRTWSSPYFTQALYVYCGISNNLAFLFFISVVDATATVNEAYNVYNG